MKYSRRILVVAALVGFPGLVLGCPGYAGFRNCTREEVKDGGCELCPATCHDYDDEDAGDAGAEDAGDAGDAGG